MIIELFFSNIFALQCFGVHAGGITDVCVSVYHNRRGALQSRSLYIQYTQNPIYPDNQ